MATKSKVQDEHLWWDRLWSIFSLSDNNSVVFDCKWIIPYLDFWLKLNVEIYSSYLGSKNLRNGGNKAFWERKIGFTNFLKTF